MNKEIINEAEYMDIVIGLLNPPFSIDNIVHLIFIAFCVKHKIKGKKYFSGKDVIDKFISNINLKLMVHTKDISIILSVIDKLVKCDFIKIVDSKIYILKPIVVDLQNEFLLKCKSRKTNNPILESKKLDSNAFIEEILRYV